MLTNILINKTMTQVWHKYDTSMTQVWHECDTCMKQVWHTQVWHKYDTSMTQVWHIQVMSGLQVLWSNIAIWIVMKKKWGQRVEMGAKGRDGGRVWF